MNRFYISISFLCIFFFVYGCSNVSVPQPKGLTYIVSDPIYLRVDRLEIQKKYVSSKKFPYVDHLFPTPPSVMVQQWVKDRLVPQGSGGTGDHVLLTIEDASVVEERLHPSSGLKSLFITNQSERYNARISVKIEIIDAQGYSKAYAHAQASASTTVAENITLNQRHQAWLVLTEKLMNNLNAEVEKTLRQYLSLFISG